MRPIRTALRFWITLSAGFSFVSGWVLLAHAPKPVQASSATTSVGSPVSTLTPLPPLDLSGNLTNQGLQAPRSGNQQQSPAFVAGPPLFTTGGS